MHTDAQQTLTYIDPGGVVSSTLPDNWVWRIDSGGGSIDPLTGEYTAPATNVGCAQNPTISVVNNTGIIVSSITLAINANWDSHNAAYSIIEEHDCYLDPGWGYSCHFTTSHYSCDGTTYLVETSNIGHGATCTECYGPTIGTITDERTAESLAAGCCVAALL
jgi:hypothetical protein